MSTERWWNCGISLIGWAGSEPTRAGLAVGDMFAGLNCMAGILASLYKRMETGKLPKSVQETAGRIIKLLFRWRPKLNT